MTARDTASSDRCPAVRRVGRTTTVQLCDPTCPDRLVLMSAKHWCGWKDEVAHGLLKPETDGEQVITKVQDREVSKAVQQVFTTTMTYEVFQQTTAKGRFDGLSPVPAGKLHGPWIWAGGTLDEEQAKALNGAA